MFQPNQLTSFHHVCDLNERIKMQLRTVVRIIINGHIIVMPPNAMTHYYDKNELTISRRIYFVT